MVLSYAAPLAVFVMRSICSGHHALLLYAAPLAHTLHWQVKLGSIRLVLPAHPDDAACLAALRAAAERGVALAYGTLMSQ